jgi:hypothetical protein
MKFYRLFTGPDGRSHFENLAQPDALSLFETAHPVKALFLRRQPSPHIAGWHPAPRRQWVITLAGSVEIVVGDGTRVSFGPGDVFLAEDVNGQGHIANAKDWIRAFIHVDP